MIVTIDKKNTKDLHPTKRKTKTRQEDTTWAKQRLALGLGFVLCCDRVREGFKVRVRVRVKVGVRVRVRVRVKVGRG